MMDYMNMDERSIGMFWVVSYIMAQPAYDTVMNWLSSAGVTELLPGSNMPNERVMREVSPIPMTLISGFSMNLCLKLAFQMEEALFSNQVSINGAFSFLQFWWILLLLLHHCSSSA